MSFFVFDIETLGIESTAVVLSAALLYVDPDTLPTDNNKAYAALLKECCVVKFDAQEQIEHTPARTVDTGTVAWWTKQSYAAKNFSLRRGEIEYSVKDGSEKLVEYLKSKPNALKLPIWVRGSLDQPLYGSLLRSFQLPELMRYNNFRDVRTAVELLYPSSAAGYVEIPDFNDAVVIKHIPTHDCVYDALQLLRGKQ